MRLTTKSENSILALIYLARHEGQGFIKLEEICRQYSISPKYLDQLFIILRKHGFIGSKRGSDGGYSLAKPARQIKISDVIRLMDGALAPIEAVSKYFYIHSPIEKEPKIMKVFKEIRDYVANRMEKLRLSDLI
jgi:Rrf2 family protein